MRVSVPTQRRGTDRAAFYAGRAVSHLQRVAAGYDREPPRVMDDLRHDVALAARLNALRVISLEVLRRGEVFAAWTAYVTDRCFQVFGPVPFPSEGALCAGRYTLALYLRGECDPGAFRSLCRLEWSAGATELTHRLTGVVDRLPRAGRPGRVTGTHPNVLLPREAEGLRVGDRVEFTAGRNGGRTAAFHLSRPGGAVHGYRAGLRVSSSGAV
jgi:hypothetical protein